MTSRLAKDHIVITAITPGPFKSDMNAALATTKPGPGQADRSSGSVKRIGTDLDLARAQRRLLTCKVRIMSSRVITSCCVEVPGKSFREALPKFL
jgi:NAD(P)-dependent dehydrogenase (short-subunit alcohol dehydrogenase family)